MPDIKAAFNRKDMTLQEAVDYFRGRVPVTADVFYELAKEYRASHLQSAAIPKRRS